MVVRLASAPAIYGYGYIAKFQIQNCSVSSAGLVSLSVLSMKQVAR